MQAEKKAGQADDASSGAIRRLVCVVALIDNSKDIINKMIGYQQYVHSMFAKALPKFKQTPSSKKTYDTQYAAVNLNWHPELQNFVYQVQDSFDMDKKKLNFMVMTSDNEAFSIFSASSRILHIIYECSQANK